MSSFAAMDRKWWTLVAVLVGVFMLLLDITIVNVALPSIQKDLDSSFSDLQWVVDAYALSLASTLLVSGSVADLIGRRRVFVIGLVLFSLASLGCGLVDTPLHLNLFRALQGIGGGMMFATSLALIAQAFQGRERGIAFGAFGAVVGASVAIGPVLGGILTDAFSWQAVFLVNIPVGIGAVALTLAKVDESRDPSPAGVDFPGAVTLTGFLFFLIFALVRGNAEGWGSTLIVTFLSASVVFLALFVAIELRREHPLFDLTLLRKPAFLGASLTAFALSASMFSMFLYLTLYLQGVLDLSPLEAGLRFLPLSLLSFLVGPLAGRLSERMPVRWLMGGGLLVVSFGLLLMHGVRVGDEWTTLLAGFVVAGIGVGLVNPPLASTAIGVVEQRRSGMASGVNTTFRQVGLATGIAALGAIFQHRIDADVAEKLAGTPVASRAGEFSEAVAAGATQQAAAGAPPRFRGELIDIGHAAFISGMNTLLVVSVIVAFVGAIGTAILVRPKDFVAHGAPEPAPPGGRGLARRGHPLQHGVVHVEVAVHGLDVVVLLERVDQAHQRARVVLVDGGAQGGPHADLGGLDLHARLLERLADRDQVGVVGDHLEHVAVDGHVLGPGVDRGHQVVLGVQGGVHHQLALALEEVVHRARLAQVPVELGEDVAHLGAGAVAVVGQGVDQQGHAAGAVALVDDPLERVGVLVGAGALVDRPLDVVLGHRVVLGLLDGQGQGRVALDVSPALTGGDGDGAGELGEQRAALGVGGALLVLDRGPLGMTGHDLSSLERLRRRTCRRARVPGRRR